jgi:hypothetical protein
MMKSGRSGGADILSYGKKRSLGSSNFGDRELLGTPFKGLQTLPGSDLSYV